MKIGIIGHLKFPIAKPFSGGLESFTHAFVASLVRRGHHVTLFAAGDSDSTLPVVPVVPMATIPDSIRTLGRVDHGWVEEVEDLAYLNLMNDLIDSDFDVLHNHSLSPIPLNFASSLPTGLITTLHVPVLPRMEAAVLSNSSERCGQFVNISAVNAKAWSHLLHDQTVIHNGVDTDFWRAHGQSQQRRAVWFGRILSDKGTALAIQAAHRAGLYIDVVGPISDQSYFDDCVSPLLLQEDCYHGHLKHQQLCKVVGRAAVTFVTPCWDEPFGLVVAESLACGTPVAGFARGALPELVTASTGRLATPGDIDALANAAIECLQLNSDVCRRVAQERFGFERMMMQYEDLYLSLQAQVAA